MKAGGLNRRLARWPLAVASVLPALAVSAGVATAYIGPGAGIAFFGSFMVLFATLFVAGISLLTWPARFLVRRFRSRKATRRRRVDRVVILGLDGLDPRLCERFIAAGKLPNFEKLRDQGTFQPLATTYPCVSPVAWSTFMTGVNPAKHNIFDFLARNPLTYKPAISSSKIEEPSRTLRLGRYVIPLNRPAVRSLRRSTSFWKILGAHGVPCQVIRVPITFPPERFNGTLLSGMCAPDLRGTQGSFTYWSTDPEEVGEATGGERHRLVSEGSDRALSGHVPGPPNSLTREREILSVPFRLTLDPESRSATLDLDGRRIRLEERRYTDWVQLTFKAGLGVKVHGIARFYITRWDDHFGLYMTPIHLDPDHPAMPISHPSYFAVYLAKLLGRYATLGLAEDTWALNERVIDEQAFLDQAYLFFDEREKQLWNALDKTREGFCVCVFDTTDRIQHMFFRYIDPDNPAYNEPGAERWRQVIEDVYRRADELLGKLMARTADDRTALMVVSDHGFASFRRGVNINAWLAEEGYLTLKKGRSGDGEWFADVDWSQTRAYAFGLGGVFLNLDGREGQGTVAPGEEAERLTGELIEKLARLEDPAGGGKVVREAVAGTRIYSGPYARHGPDLVVGFNRGYRVSWGCAVGKVNEPVVADNTKSWSGDHCIDPRLVPGIFFCNRDAALADDSGEAEPLSIADIAPTVLDLFGIEPPAHMDGRRLEVAAPGERLDGRRATGPERAGTAA